MGAVLDRVRDVVHGDDPNFAALAALHARADETRAAVERLEDPDSEAARALAADLATFTAFLAMVEERDALDDERYAQLEETVSTAFGRPLAMAVARGRLVMRGAAPPPPPPKPPAARAARPAPEPPPAPAVELRLERDVEAEPAPAVELRLERDVEAEPAPVAPAAESRPAAEQEPAREPSGPDETAQWWLAAWARWSGWKNTLQFADAAREEVGKYPYLLAVPIQESPEHEDGLLAYGYSILLEHVEKQKPGCVGNALQSLKPRPGRSVGALLYDYLVAEGRLDTTYPEFVRNVLLAALPEPGLWFQSRILESRDDTRIFRRPTERVGETDQTGQRLSSDSQRYAEHTVSGTLKPLTTLVHLVACDLRESRGVEVKVRCDGEPSDAAWLVTVPATGRAAKVAAQRLAAQGSTVAGLGKDFSAVWIAVFNADPTAERRYEVAIQLRRAGKRP
jgi:hypothetical protein